MFLTPFTGSARPLSSSERQAFSAPTRFGFISKQHTFSKILSFTLLGDSYRAEDRLDRERNAFFIPGWISCNLLYRAENTASKLLLTINKYLLWSKSLKLESFRQLLVSSKYQSKALGLVSTRANKSSSPGTSQTAAAALLCNSTDYKPQNKTKQRR